MMRITFSPTYLSGDTVWQFSQSGCIITALQNIGVICSFCEQHSKNGFPFVRLCVITYTTTVFKFASVLRHSPALVMMMKPLNIFILWRGIIMKHSKRFLCLLLTLILAASLCVFPAAATDQTCPSSKDDPVVFVHGLMGWASAPASTPCSPTGA